jgi:hypothetical protein
MADTIAPLQYSTSTAPLIIEAYAAHYGIAAQPLIDTLRCESGFDSNAVGDHGTSFGVAQIHLPAHPDVTEAEALDPFFSIDFAASEFAAGHPDEWTCFRRLDKPNRVSDLLIRR